MDALPLDLAIRLPGQLYACAKCPMKLQRLGLGSPPVVAPPNAVGCQGTQALPLEGQLYFNDWIATSAVDLITFIVLERFTNLDKKSYTISVWLDQWVDGFPEPAKIAIHLCFADRCARTKR